MFGEHLQIASAKAIQCGAALTRVMPNIGGPREAKRARWGVARKAVGREVGAQLTLDTMVSLMLQSERICTCGPAPWADLAVHVESGSNLLVPPQVGAASRSAKRACGRGWEFRANG